MRCLVSVRLWAGVPFGGLRFPARRGWPTQVGRRATANFWIDFFLSEGEIYRQFLDWVFGSVWGVRLGSLDWCLVDGFPARRGWPTRVGRRASANFWIVFFLKGDLPPIFGLALWRRLGGFAWACLESF